MSNFSKQEQVIGRSVQNSAMYKCWVYTVLYIKTNETSHSKQQLPFTALWWRPVKSNCDLRQVVTSGVGNVKLKVADTVDSTYRERVKKRMEEGEAESRKGSPHKMV